MTPWVVQPRANQWLQRTASTVGWLPGDQQLWLLNHTPCDSQPPDLKSWFVLLQTSGNVAGLAENAVIGPCAGCQESARSQPSLSPLPLLGSGLRGINLSCGLPSQHLQGIAEGRERGRARGGTHIKVPE
jgi:hypothetical protein